ARRAFAQREERRVLRVAGDVEHALARAIARGDRQEHVAPGARRAPALQRGERLRLRLEERALLDAEQVEGGDLLAAPGADLQDAADLLQELWVLPQHVAAQAFAADHRE